MSEANKALLRTIFHETERRGKVDPEMFAPGFTAHYAGRPPMDFASFEQFMGMYFTAFSDVSRTFEDMVAEGDRVAFRVVARATHTGDLMGIPASGKQVTVQAIGIARIADGKLAEMWESADRMGLMQQLGAIPAPGQVGAD